MLINSMIPQNMQSQPSILGNNCGSANKCSSCNMKLICARSPFCCVCNTSSQSTSNLDLSPIESKIDDLFIDINNSIVSIEGNNNSNMQTLANNLNGKIIELQNSFNAQVVELSHKLQSIVETIENVTSTINSSGVSVLSTQANTSTESGLVPASYSVIPDNGTVLVEKKNIFGKPTGKYKEVKTNEV